MKIVDLVRDGKPCVIRHPEIGRVAWREDGPGAGYALYFAGGGIDEGKPLLADAAVLFDDRWAKSR